MESTKTYLTYTSNYAHLTNHKLKVINSDMQIKPVFAKGFNTISNLVDALISNHKS